MPRSSSATSSIAPQFAPVRREARVVAAAIDLVVISLLGLSCAATALIAMLMQVDPFKRDPTAGEWVVGYTVLLLWIPAASIYAGAGSRTLGARLLRLHLSGGTRARAIVRGVMWWPSLLLLGAGLWWTWIDPRGRSLTDVVSGAVLVEAIDP